MMTMSKMHGFVNKTGRPWVVLAALLFLGSLGAIGFSPRAQSAVPTSGPSGPNDGQTISPIKHVIVIVGENRTFDHVYGTYQPKNGQQIWNLLSRGIINQDGTPGPNFGMAKQFNVTSTNGRYDPSPTAKTPYGVLPPPMAGGPKVPYVSTVQQAAQAETALPDSDLPLLTTGGTGLEVGQIDSRIPNVNSLPPGPFSLTPGVSYDAYSASPVHRFFQMWQELDCNATAATSDNPSGCRGDLFAWVETSVGQGTNGNRPPVPFNDQSTLEGASALGFYNMAKGDAPYFKLLADTYSMSDNFHQAIEGGTGANHIALGTGDAIWFSDGKGNALAPPALNVENPDPQAGTVNLYTQDGYSGGSYSECADTNQPGVGPIVTYLNSLHVSPNCEAGHYYLLNNYAPGYYGDGTVNPNNFVIPPSSVRTIADSLQDHGISWRYYGDQWDRYLNDPNGTAAGDGYCNICNPFQYSSSIMENATERTEHLKDSLDFYADIQNGWLPAFSIIKPSDLVDGHPASSKLDLFEGFAQKVVDAVKSQPQLWQNTVIFVTFDEGGGYYDSGYIQPLDFFGDGTRIPLIAVSAHAKPAYISHEYTDHVSILKFVEKNWSLAPLTSRSRDNLPDPQTDGKNPWVPRNGRSIGDLFDMFDFSN